MKTTNGPSVTYKLVYKIFPVEIHQLQSDGFFHVVGKSSGVLVEGVSMGRSMYHYPEDYLVWKHTIPQTPLHTQRKPLVNSTIYPSPTLPYRLLCTNAKS